MPIKICSWNVHHSADAKAIRDTVLSLADSYDLDVIFLQEVVSDSTKNIRTHVGEAISEILPAYDYRYVEHPSVWRGIKEGVATFSRLPIVGSHTLNLGHRHMLQCTLQYNDTIINTLNLHLSPLNSLRNILRNLQERRQLVDVIESYSPASIIAGDFNTPLSSGFVQQLADSYLNSDSSPTWRWGTLGSYALLEEKFDYVLTGTAFKHISTKIVPVGLSDHLPLVVELELK